MDQSRYDVMQVCRRGHMITDSLRSNPESGKKRCPDCGQPTIEACESCGAPIQGYKHIPGVVYPGPEGPRDYCHECGEPYPWAGTRDASASDGTATTPQSGEIFVVHGHDEEMKQSVARLLSQIGLTPVILHERPNRGRTLIEKFEQNAGTGFAVVLMSPDDEGYAVRDGDKALKPRARQNVVLELGYFVGSLDRGRVVALCRGSDLELPGDIAGVVYTAYDQGGAWRLELVRELRAAGYEVDANSIL